MVYLHPDRTRKELLVPDLGGDRIWRLQPDAEESEGGGWRVSGVVELVPGTGPRHVIVHGTSILVLLPIYPLISGI